MTCAVVYLYLKGESDEEFVSRKVVSVALPYFEAYPSVLREAAGNSFLKFFFESLIEIPVKFLFQLNFVRIVDKIPVKNVF